MKNSFVLVIFLFFSVIVFAEEAEKELLEKLPKELNEFSGREIESFDDKRLGASAGFQYGDAEKHTTLTIILFDAGLGPISEGVSSQVTNRAYKAALSDIRTYEREGYYRYVEKLDDKAIKIGKNEFLYSKLNYSIQRENGLYMPVQSYLLMTGTKGYMLKIRVTGNTDNLNDKLIFTISDKVLSAINS